MNHQDDRHEVEHPTDSSVVAATHSLSDSEIVPRQDYSESMSHRDINNSEQEDDSEFSDNNPSLGEAVVNEQVNHILRPSLTRVTSSSSRDASQSCLRLPVAIMTW